MVAHIKSSSLKLSVASNASYHYNPTRVWGRMMSLPYRLPVRYDDGFIIN